MGVHVPEHLNLGQCSDRDRIGRGMMGSPFRRIPFLPAQALFGLVHVRGIKPEVPMLRDEPAGMAQALDEILAEGIVDEAQETGS